MVTTINKKIPKAAKKSPASKSARATPTRRASAPRDDADGAIPPQAAPSQHNGHSKGAIGDNPILMRGKDLLSEEAGGIATAAAIGIGAALIEIELVPGLIIGAAAILLGKLFPQIGATVRPALKGVIRAGFSVSHKAREVMAEASEQVHDLVAEVKYERGHAPHSVPRASAAHAAGMDGASHPTR